MAYIQNLGQGMVLPMFTNLSTVFNNTLLINATGEKTAVCGRVWWPARDSGTKGIRKVHFRLGAVTKSGGSAWTFSLQDVSLTAGPPMQPDGSQDQTYAIANGDAGFVSNAWYTTGNLSADRTVSMGSLVACVLEFNGNRVNPDSVEVSSMTANSSSLPWLLGGLSALFTSSWAAVAQQPIILLEFSDGTFGTLEGSFPLSAINTHSFHLNTGTADEFALAFKVNFACKIDGIWANIFLGAAGDVELILYEGTTALETCTIDANAVYATGNARPYFYPFDERQLTIGTQYYVAVRPTTATACTCYSLDVAAAGHWGVWPGGADFNYSTRLDQGSWAAVTTTRRMHNFGIRISSLGDEASAGGGMLVHPGMAGGMRG